MYDLVYRKGVYMICPKCGNEYSDKEKACPKCGTTSAKPNENREKNKLKQIPMPAIIAIIVGICVMAGAIFYVAHSHKKDAENDKPKKVTSEKADKKDKKYDFPSIDEKVLTEKELDAMSASDLELAENEIYARHGRIFDDEKYKKHFEKKSWYKPKLKPDEFDSKVDTLLNDVEKENLKNIKEYLRNIADESKDSKEASSNETKSASSSSDSYSKGSDAPLDLNEAEAIVRNSNTYRDFEYNARQSAGEDLAIFFNTEKDMAEGKEGYKVVVLIDHPGRYETAGIYFVDSNRNLYKLDIINNAYNEVS